MKYQIIGTDIVATDAAATKVFGIKPKELKHIPLAEQHGIGTSNLDGLNIKRISI